ncbi:hypothetical protein ACFX13_012631 [Malus domestica]
MKSETNDSIGLQTARFAALCNRLCYYGSLTTAGVTLGAHENIVKVAKIVESKGKQPTTLGEGVKAERRDPHSGECKQTELSFMPRRCAWKLLHRNFSMEDMDGFDRGVAYAEAPSTRTPSAEFPVKFLLFALIFSCFRVPTFCASTVKFPNCPITYVYMEKKVLHAWHAGEISLQHRFLPLPLRIDTEYCSTKFSHHFIPYFSTSSFVLHHESKQKTAHPNQFQLTQIPKTQISPDCWNQFAFAFAVANLQTRTPFSSEVPYNQGPVVQILSIFFWE